MAISKITTGSISDSVAIDTDTLVVDGANNRVGVGTASPPQKFVVSNAGADNIVMCENSSASIQMFMQAQNGVGAVGTLTNHDTVFLSNNTERMRILAGGGLTFNGDTAAANALDDYEEGTWSPTLYQGGIQITSLTSAHGHYRKIGNLLFLNFYVYKNGGANSGSGTWEIGNLPYNPGTGYYQSFHSGYMGINSVDYFADYSHRWQANSSGYLTLYGNSSTRVWGGGYVEMAGTGTMWTAY